MTTAFNVARIMGVLSLLVALAGCSAIRLGYNNLDEVTYWWLDGYVDFDDTQTLRVREDLSRWHRWHRSTELPRMADLLQRTERLAGGPVTATQLCALVPEVRARLQAAGQQAEPALVTAALTLTPAQLQNIERKFARNNEEFRKKWVRLSAADLLDKRTEQIAERAETLYGTLSDAQQNALRQQLANSTYDPNHTLAARQQRQQDTLLTLRRLASQPLPLDQARMQVRTLLERLTSSADAPQRARQDMLIQESCSTLAALHNSATAEQRERAVQRLRSYQRDLLELANER